MNNGAAPQLSGVAEGLIEAALLLYFTGLAIVVLYRWLKWIFDPAEIPATASEPFMDSIIALGWPFFIFPEGWRTVRELRAISRWSPKAQALRASLRKWRQ